MLEMFTIEPLRRFIIPRATARHVWKTPPRFVLMTSFQSSSGIRASRPSRVTPALFTRMSRSPASRTRRLASSALATSACTAVAPASAATCSASSRPELELSVTLAPARANSSAIARPIPREPPVTRAVLPSSDANASGRGERLLELFEPLGRRDGDGLGVAVDPLDQPRQDSPGPDLDERVHAFADERLRSLREPHRSGELVDEQGAHPFRILDPRRDGRHERR